MMRSFADVARPGRDAERPRLPLAQQTERTVTTPNFSGRMLPGQVRAEQSEANELARMTFLEVETRSALNRVSGMPFAWSINPYRGCSHACSYCMAGDSPILLADGRTRALADVRRGDEIVGTRPRGGQRYCVRTRVLDHWSVTRRAYRVRLTDDTELVTSGDHRLLTDRGWRHVAAGPDGRPHLTTSHHVVGIGDAAPASDLAADRRAYLTGLTRVAEITALGVDMPLFDITTGTGDYVANGVVSHNCFARPTHEYLGLSPGADFERKVVVKTNVVEVLRAELARPSWRGEKVALGTNTDPYQRCEGRYRLMPGIVRALADARTPLSILTKGTLITRDRALLGQIARQVEVTAAFTVGMLDDDAWRATEPGTPPPRARLDAVRALNDAGVPTGVMLAPVMPGINDDRDQLAALVDLAASAGASHITPIVLHLRPGVREVFWPWLRAVYPQLVDRYRVLYRGSEAPRAYRDAVTDFVVQQRQQARRRHGQPQHAPSPRFAQAADHQRGPQAVGRAHAVEQLRLL